MILPYEIILETKNYGNERHPREACGIITCNGDGIHTFHPIINVSKSNDQWDYVFHPEQYLNVMKLTDIFDKTSNIKLKAFFHTHPRNAAIPSIYDKAGASWKTTYIIYSRLFDQYYGWEWDGHDFTHVKINDEFHDSMLNKKLIYKDNISEGDWDPWKNIELA